MLRDYAWFDHQETKEEDHNPKTLTLAEQILESTALKFQALPGAFHNQENGKRIAEENLFQTRPENL